MVDRTDIEIKKNEINTLTDEVFKGEFMKKYDNSVGSFPREIIRAIITELLVQKNIYDITSEKNNPLLATGNDLDHICEQDYIYRQPAIAATGKVKIYGEPGSIIHQGYQVASTNCTYNITETKEIPYNGIIGTTTVNIEATEQGIVGNVKIGEINSFAVSYQGLEKVENEESIENGKEIETDEELRERRKNKLSKPCVNYNKQVIENLLLTNFKEIKKLKIIPRFNGKGTAKIVVIGKDNKEVEENMLNEIKNFLDTEIITDAKFTINTIKEKNINITLEAILNKEYSEQNAIELTKEVLDKAFLEHLFTENRIYYAEIIDKLLEIKAFKKISNIDINNTKEDVILADEDLAKVSSVIIKDLD